MRQKGLSGQLNLFDFFREPERTEDGSVKPVEMISLMSPFTPEPEPEEEPPEKVVAEAVVEPSEEPPAEVVAEAIVEPPEEPPAEVVAEAVVEPPEEPSAEVVAEAVVEPPVEEVAEAPAPVVEPQPKPQLQEAAAKKAAAVMQQCYEKGGEYAFFAYLNYNKVYEKLPDAEPLLYRFEDSKEAVGYYIGKIRTYAELPGWQNSQNFPEMEDAKAVEWRKTLEKEPVISYDYE